MPFGRPREIKRHIRHVVKEFAMKEGGLMIESEIHPPTPLRNIEALVESMEKYMWLLQEET